MIRSELLKTLIQENPGLRADEVETALDTFFDAIAARLADGGRVELRRFGAFFTSGRRARQARNPKTGARVAVEEKRAIRFRAGKPLVARLNGKGAR